MTRQRSNSVRIAGLLVRRQDQLAPKRVPRIVFEVYNPDVHEVFRAVAYGRNRLKSIGPEIAEGQEVEIEGMLRVIRRHMPGTGRVIEELGIEVENIRLLQRERAPQQPRQQASAGHVAEMSRLATRLGLDRAALHAYLGGRAPEDIPFSEVEEILHRMALEVQAAESRIQRGVQLDCLMALAEVPNRKSKQQGSNGDAGGS